MIGNFVISGYICNPILVATFPKWLSSTGTMAAHTRRRASVLVVFVLFCVHMFSSAGLLSGHYRRRSVTLQSPTATQIPLFSSLDHNGRGFFWSVGSKISFGHVSPLGGKPSTSFVYSELSIHLVRCFGVFLERVVFLLISILPKNQAAPIEMVISDFLRIPKTFIAFVSLCHKSPKARGKL